MRRLADGREFRVVKVYREAATLREALERAGFEDVRLDATARFFQMGTAVRAG